MDCGVTILKKTSNMHVRSYNAKSWFCNNHTYEGMSPATLELVFLIDAINTCRGIESDMVHEQCFTCYQGLAALSAFRQFTSQTLLDYNIWRYVRVVEK